MSRPAAPRHLYADSRIPALVKHELLGSYLEQLAIRVGMGWESLLYVDGFAGPWGSSADCEDSSFGIAIGTMARVQRILNDRFGRTLALHGYLIERSRPAFHQLSEFASKHDGKPVRIMAKKGRFENHVDDIGAVMKRLGPKSFSFLLLDPKGWKGLAMERIRPIAHQRSSEILVNVMVKFLVRFLKEDDRAESYREFFGRDGVREIVHALPQEQRPDALVREYCKSLKSICGYKYVSSCLVLNEEKNQARYFMVFATNHHRGIEVFKDAETHASNFQETAVARIKTDKRQKRSGHLELPLLDESRYLQMKKAEYARKAFTEMRKKIEEGGRLLYRDVFCEAAAFPLVTKSMIKEQLRSMADIRFELEEIPDVKRKEPSCDQLDYCVIV